MLQLLESTTYLAMFIGIIGSIELIYGVYNRQSQRALKGLIEVILCAIIYSMVILILYFKYLLG